MEARTASVIPQGLDWKKAGNFDNATGLAFLPGKNAIVLDSGCEIDLIPQKKGRG
jgi:hypothetical protein